MSKKIKRLRELFNQTWRERLETLKHDRDDPNDEEPQDLMQMMVRYAAKYRPEQVRDLDEMTRRLIANNFASIHQTAIQATNHLLNIVGSNSEFNTKSVLSHEINEVLSTDGDERWTKAKVNKVMKADSVSRETLRLHSFGGRSMFRLVGVDDFRTPEGIHLPKGTIISFLGQPAQTDPEIFEEPLRFDPFRFYRIREEAGARNKNTPLVTFVSTAPDFLPFSHGKHACPGRFLVDFELKMIMAHILRHYESSFLPITMASVRQITG
ncbi:Fumitremorgin C monooxygenase 1 [Colletotrichum chlorophyti]|uniref:Fumitremorgin C monooxygenase 1 n=1 Tax=Colletotrichum chlorophyti TaxID=708187 RepID=A0A1Q8S6Q7_9PEZI|nr:Fumitremorgin C monooxygenase 1 [Colletotrichum chlorophyti]